MDPHRVEHSIELLCQKGCRAVWKDIETLERGDSLPETRGLSDAEVRVVVDELKAIMAVYEGTCSVN